MSDDKQQTAVEWFMEKIGEKQPNGFYVIDTLHDVQNVFQQAKEMEKEQIVNTWSEATAPQHEIGLSDASYVIAQIKKAERYYNETYGGNK
jgi:hypothetical protein